MINVGVDFGNMNVDCVANIDRKPRIRFSNRAYVGTPDHITTMQTGETQRSVLYQPFHANIGITAEQESALPEHVISLERYYAGPRKEARRPLSEYAQKLIYYTIGKALSLLSDDLPDGLLYVTLGVAVAQNHYSDELAEDFNALCGKHDIEIDDHVHRTIMIPTVMVRTQLYSAMFSQYIKIEPDGTIKKKDEDWEKTPGAIEDIGSHHAQRAIFRPRVNKAGQKEIAAHEFNCSEYGMLSCLSPLRDRIRAANEMFSNLTDAQLVRILETGELDGLDFHEYRDRILREKAQQMLGDSRKLFASGQHVRRIILTGRGAIPALDTYQRGYADATTKIGVPVELAKDDDGQPMPDFAVADGIHKRVYHYTTRG